MKKILIAFAILISSGFLACTTNFHINRARNNIVPFGKDTYTITYRGRSYTAIRTIIYKASNKYCNDQGKVFSPHKEEKRRREVEVVFRCLDENDPEYDRPVWKQDPNVVIEDRRK